MAVFSKIKLIHLLPGDYFKSAGDSLGTFCVIGDAKQKGSVRVRSLRLGKELVLSGHLIVNWVMPPAGTDPDLPCYFSAEEEAHYVSNLIDMARAGSKTAEESLRDFCGA